MPKTKAPAGYAWRVDDNGEFWHLVKLTDRRVSVLDNVCGARRNPLYDKPLAAAVEKHNACEECLRRMG